jgi:phospholipid/cholesterol/gamma-HCH transport system permease protein
MNGWAAPALQGFARVGDLSLFGFRVLTDAFRRPFELREIVRQIGEVGLLSLPLIAASGLAVGAVMSMHTRSTLARFGAEASIPVALAIALVRETGPLVTALLVSGRVGAAIGAELGAMRVTEQIDALESLAVDSFKYLAVTRVVACTLSLPILTTVMNFSGMLGGSVAEHAASGMSFELYFRRAFAALEFTELIPATLKTAVFGFIIGTLSSYLGYSASGGSAGVGRASTSSVVYSSLCLILANVLLVRAIFFFLPDAP